MRWLLRALLIIVLLFVLVAGAIGWRLWRALPRLDGTVTVTGLRAPVEILRDTEGVPHIRAESEADAVFALGFVHAQDRLWQMEFQRRLAGGRLAAILGESAVDTDRLMRTIGFVRAAEEALAALDEETRALLETYAAGVNACLTSHPGTRLPVEFAILRFAPEPWRAADVIAWHKVMGWSMSLNWREELLRVRLAARVGTEGAAALLPAYTAGGPIVLPQFRGPEPAAASDGADVPSANAAAGLSARAWQELSASATALLGVAGSSAARRDPFVGAGSNNWVISGARTASGRPLLANDPHLGTQTPGVWYVAHLKGGSLDVIGATLPGAPAVVIGHNGHVAWGVTNMMADVQDLFVERLNDRDETEVNGRWEPMRVLHQVIEVRGAPDIPLRIRLTRRGPLVSDVIDERAALSLRWTGHDPEDRTAASFFHINRARSWEAFTAAFNAYHVPMLNFVYADTQGNIGYVGPGALPLRRGDGRLPLPGWTDANHWRGYVSRADLPRALNPPAGFIASANNQAVPDGYPHVVSTTWEAPYRAARIDAVLESIGAATIEDMQRLQADVHSAQADAVLPFLLTARPASAAGGAALELLQNWDRSLSPSSAGAALFKAFTAAAAEHLFADDLGPVLWNDYRGATGTVAKALDRVARQGDHRWCDDVNTPAAETCAETLGRALDAAVEDLTVRQGSSEPSRWRWGRENLVWFPHLPFHASGWLRPVFSRSVVPGGDAFTVNPAMRVREQTLVASYRQIVDLADVDQSVFLLPLGQSGHLLSGRYAEFLDDWAQARYRPLRFTDTAVDRAATSRLLLTP